VIISFDADNIENDKEHDLAFFCVDFYPLCFSVVEALGDNSEVLSEIETMDSEQISEALKDIETREKPVRIVAEWNGDRVEATVGIHRCTISPTGCNILLNDGLDVGGATLDGFEISHQLAAEPLKQIKSIALKLFGRYRVELYREDEYVS